MRSFQTPLFVFLSLFAVSRGFAQDRQDISLRSEIDQVQPMTGIVLWSDHEQVATKAISLEYRYCGYNEVVQPSGEYDFAKLDQVLDEIAGRGHQAVIRFYFAYVGKKTTVPEFIRSRADYDETVGTSEGEKTYFCDWSNPTLQAFTLEFYSRIAERYDTDPRIAFLQTGFGLWAEYHIYEGPRTLGKTFPSKEYQAKFLTHLARTFKHLPWAISVDAADNEYSPLEDNRDLLALNFGVFDDSFLCKSHPKENAVNWKILGSERWQQSPAGGEFSYYNRRDQKNALATEGPNGVSFKDAARQFHISYMIGNDQPEFRSLEEIQAASMATGYRFRVTAATLEGTTLILTVTNEGVAPIYRDAYFAAGGKRSATSLRGLLPEQVIECRINGVNSADTGSIAIQSDAILPTQMIQFSAEL